METYYDRKFSNFFLDENSVAGEQFLKIFIYWKTRLYIMTWQAVLQPPKGFKKPEQPSSDSFHLCFEQIVRKCLLTSREGDKSSNGSVYQIQYV